MAQLRHAGLIGNQKGFRLVSIATPAHSSLVKQSSNEINSKDEVWEIHGFAVRLGHNKFYDT